MTQARACELVDRLTQTDVTLSAQALRRSGDLGIESYRCPRDTTVASQIHEPCITDAARALRRSGKIWAGLPGDSFQRQGVVKRFAPSYSHSMVAGGLLVMSRTTRLTSAHSLVIRVEIFSSSSHGSFAQSAVMASSKMTGRSTMGCP